jgi:hypothetical protein
MRPDPSRITRREMWFATAVYRWTVTRQAWAKFRYRRLGGRCYECPGAYGRHKFSCSVGARETDLQR